MSGAGASLRDPTECFADEIAGYHNLLNLLHSEQEALRAADADGLAKIMQPKMVQIGELQELAAMRAKALCGRGLTETAAGMSTLLGESAHPESARAAWNTLLGVAAHAQRQNSLNMRLASVQQRYVDGAIATLWRAAGCESTYGADGRSRHHASPRTLASI